MKIVRQTLPVMLNGWEVVVCLCEDGSIRVAATMLDEDSEDGGVIMTARLLPPETWGVPCGSDAANALMEKRN